MGGAERDREIMSRALDRADHVCGEGVSARDKGEIVSMSER